MRFIVTILLIWSSLLFSGENYHRSSKSSLAQLGPQHSPLGFLGASGIFQSGRNDIRVKFVDNYSIANNGGLRVGDIIVGVNRKKFKKATNSVGDGGKGPREDLGVAMDKSLHHKDKILRLSILRGNKNIGGVPSWGARQDL